MRRRVIKWFWAWDYEKEEKWLNEMSSKGLQLVSVGFANYTFEESEREKYIYRLELLNDLPSNYKSQSYISFLEETGIEHVGTVFRWAYFRKKAIDGPFELYSDLESKIKHYKRIMTLFLGITPVLISSACLNISNYFNFRSNISLGCSIIASTFVFLLGLGVVKVYRRLSSLKKEKLIRE